MVARLYNFTLALRFFVNKELLHRAFSIDLCSDGNLAARVSWGCPGPLNARDDLEDVVETHFSPLIRWARHLSLAWHLLAFFVDYNVPVGDRMLYWNVAVVPVFVFDMPVNYHGLIKVAQHIKHEFVFS